MESPVSKRVIFAAGLALGLPFGLAACGEAENTDHDSVDVTDNEGPDREADNPEGETDDGRQSLPNNSEDEPDAPTTGSASSDGEKPSRDDVSNGLKVMFGHQLSAMGFTPERIDGIEPAIEDYYTCAVDGIYDDVSVETLDVVADGNPNASVSNDDYETLNNVLDACVETELEPAVEQG